MTEASTRFRRELNESADVSESEVRLLRGKPEEEAGRKTLKNAHAILRCRPIHQILTLTERGKSLATYLTNIGDAPYHPFTVNSIPHLYTSSPITPPVIATF